MTKYTISPKRLGGFSTTLFAALFTAHSIGANEVDSEAADNNGVTASQSIIDTPLTDQTIEVKNALRDNAWGYAHFAQQIKPDTNIWHHFMAQKQAFEESGLKSARVFEEMQVYTAEYMIENASVAGISMPDDMKHIFDEVFQSIINLHYSEESAAHKAEAMLDAVRAGYVRKIASNFMLDKPLLPSKDDITDIMLEGMLSSLDEHTRYLSPKDWKVMEDNLFTSETAGFGIELRSLRDDIFIYHVQRGSPAEQAGLKSGMVINGIEEWSENAQEWQFTDFSGSSLNEVRALLVGENNSRARLHLENEGREFVELTRIMLVNNPIEVACVDDEFTHIRLRSFSENAHDVLIDTVENIEQNGGCADTSRYYLDLRNNSGGSLASTLGIVDSFLDEGMILLDDVKGTEYDTTYEATLGGVFQGKGGAPDSKLTVIINSNSASGSEIVAGNLQAYGRGDVVGMQGYGKGSAQTVISLPNGGAAIITKSMFMTGAGYTHNLSVTPNLQIEGASYDTPLMSRKRGEGVKSGLSDAVLSQNLPNAKCNVQKEFFTAAEIAELNWDKDIFHRVRLSQEPDSYISVFGSYVQAYGTDTFIVDSALVCHIVSQNPDSRYASIVEIEEPDDLTP